MSKQNGEEFMKMSEKKPEWSDIDEDKLASLGECILKGCHNKRARLDKHHDSCFCEHHRQLPQEPR